MKIGKNLIIKLRHSRAKEVTKNLIIKFMAKDQQEI